MGIEIERRFLVRNTGWKANCKLRETNRITQGYLSLDPERVVRVRKSVEGGSAARGYLTIKGKKVGSSAPEFEYPIEDFDELLDNLCLATVEKHRLIVREGDGLTWELDIFEGPLEGLEIVEVELSSADQEINIPCWVGEEITGDHRYSNLNLGLHGVPEGLDAPL
jgi:adenylate cyclase